MESANQRADLKSVSPVKPVNPRKRDDEHSLAKSLSARLEPFDSYWQAPDDVERGFNSFTQYYKYNFLPHLPENRDAKILVISCGPGYLLHMLKENGYTDVLGIDSDAEKIKPGIARGLNCQVFSAFDFLAENQGQFDQIIGEQELNHLTHTETIAFLKLARNALAPGGGIVVYGLNGANPIVGAENLAHNIDHFYLLTEYSLGQLLELAGFSRIATHPLKLYVFWKNPLNYVGLAVTSLLELCMRIVFKMYGKNVKILSKKLLAVASVAPTDRS